jgi:DNA modification methylase
LCADASDPKSWQILLEGQKAGAAITDPPYGVNYELANKFTLNKITRQEEHNKTWGEISNDQGHTAALSVLPRIFENLAPNGVAYITCGTKLLTSIANYLDSHEIRYAPFLVWDKGFSVITWERYHAAHEFIVYCGPGSYPTRGKGNAKARWFGPKNETTVWRIPIEPNNQRQHPTQKPVALYERVIINSTTRNEIVVDPFAGSGTCIIAAEKRKRRAYCIEIDPRYVDVTLQRWENYAGRKLERISRT